MILYHVLFQVQYLRPNKVCYWLDMVYNTHFYFIYLLNKL